MKPIFREAVTKDIKALHTLRMAVKENMLPDAGLISHADYESFLTEKGKGWVCEIENKIQGFAIVNLEGRNIWALFVNPSLEGKGIGKALQRLMLHWYFMETKQPVWLGTSGGTRAEKFYLMSGWKEAGKQPNGEIRFEMTHETWMENF